MSLRMRSNSRLRRDLGSSGADFLVHGLGAIGRVLPHVESTDWLVSAKHGHTVANFTDGNKRELRLEVGLSLRVPWSVQGRVSRRKVPTGVGAISRTISERERDIASRILHALATTLDSSSPAHAAAVSALRPGFDERVVAEHLTSYHGLAFDLGDWLSALRRLAEQTYENKALAFGCVVSTTDQHLPGDGARFPQDFLERKRFRALSDGYRTAYCVSAKGALIGFIELGKLPATGSRFYPEWCEDLAMESRAQGIALALTRQGDVLVLDKGNLTFSYRFGRWQYWNHTHIVDLITNAARVQNVPPALLSKVVRAIYRAALDVSFRRTGGLFVLLRRRNDLHQLVRRREAIDDAKREPLDVAFDRVVAPTHVQMLPRAVLAELAGLDGAVVLSNKGELLAYGTILDPRKKGRIAGTEGSRSKAAIGASKYGLAVKVSSDGDIKVYFGGESLIEV